ncbi:MAG: NfeD family protein [Clostridiaceae bacterium]|nr:NfeD family protein [Clostridiaceae bacterium]
MPIHVPMSAVWLALAVLFAIVEAATLGLTSIWFAVGSLGAMVVALCGGPLWLQIVLFLFLSAVTLYFTRNFAKEFFNRGRQRTNSDRIIGMEGVVTEAIDNERAVGQIRVAGQIWTARSVGETPIAKGVKVVVREISGVKTIVEPLE